MTERGKKKRLLNPCPLCGGDKIEALEQWEILDNAIGFDGEYYFMGHIKIKCKCFYGLDVQFANVAPTKKEAKTAIERSIERIERHWNGEDYNDPKWLKALGVGKDVYADEIGEDDG